MKYTVCYAIYGSMDVEADSVDTATENVCDFSIKELAEHTDDFEVTIVQDENGNTVAY